MLLKQIGIVPDQVIAPDIDETPSRDELPRLYAIRMARTKAAAVRSSDHLVLAADTVVAAGRRILPKAESPEQVRACLTLLSGRRHRVMTALVLTGPACDTAGPGDETDPSAPRMTAPRITERIVESVVTFNRLTTDQIERYVATREGEGKAGGYAINGQAASLVRFLSGSHSAVVGLPLFETAQLLRGFGWQVP
jgi:septum formation protein